MIKTLPESNFSEAFLDYDRQAVQRLSRSNVAARTSPLPLCWFIGKVIRCLQGNGIDAGVVDTPGPPHRAAHGPDGNPVFLRTHPRDLHNLARKKSQAEEMFIPR